MAKSVTPLLLIGGAALLVVASKKKKKKRVECPSTVLISGPTPFGPEVPQSNGGPLPKVAIEAVRSGERDVIKITKQILAPHISPSCVGNWTTTITEKRVLTEDETQHDPDHVAGQAIIDTSPAPEYFVTTAWWLLSELYLTKNISSAVAEINESLVYKWWAKHGDGRDLEDVEGYFDISEEEDE